VASDRGSAAKTDPAFRQWLRELRERAGLTQEQLAHAVGTDRRNIRRWEVDGHDPAGSMLMRVLDAVGVQLTPAPPSELPRAVNTELRELRERMREAADEAARRHDELRMLLDTQQRERVAGISARREELSPRRE
jgi:transcriptional regulator with XRE-family HTH domain